MKYARVLAKCASGEEKMFWVKVVGAGTICPTNFYVIVDSRGEFDDSPVCLNSGDVLHIHPAECNEQGELQALV